MIDGFFAVHRPVSGVLRLVGESRTKRSHALTVGLVDVPGNRSVQLSWVLLRSTWRARWWTYSLGLWTFEADAGRVVVDSGRGRRDFGVSGKPPQNDALLPIRALGGDLVTSLTQVSDGGTFVATPGGYAQPVTISVSKQDACLSFRLQGSKSQPLVLLGPADSQDAAILQLPWPTVVTDSATDHSGDQGFTRRRVESIHPPSWAEFVAAIRAGLLAPAGGP